MLDDLVSELPEVPVTFNISLQESALVLTCIGYCVTEVFGIEDSEGRELYSLFQRLLTKTESDIAVFKGGI